MTKWVEHPLRPAGQSWPGLNLTGGKLAKSSGELGDCVNAIINRDDTIEKRPGFVRGFNERFSGVVCGLFTYTSNCGQEFVLVADQTGFSIRTPFSLPVFEIADCYPFDSFAEEGDMDAEKWRNTGRYTQASDVLKLAGSPSETLEADLPSICARWFKDACSRSYQLRATYAFDPAHVGTQRVVIVLRGNDDLATGALLLGYLQRTPVEQRLVLIHRNAQLNFTTVAQLTLDPTDGADGDLTIAYDASTRKMTGTVVPSNATQRTVTQGQEFTAVQDADLGLRSGFGLAFEGDTPQLSLFSIAVVDGGSV